MEEMVMSFLPFFFFITYLCPKQVFNVFRRGQNEQDNDKRSMILSF